MLGWIIKCDGFSSLMCRSHQERPSLHFLFHSALLQTDKREADEVECALKASSEACPDSAEVLVLTLNHRNLEKDLVWLIERLLLFLSAMERACRRTTGTK